MRVTLLSSVASALLFASVDAQSSTVPVTGLQGNATVVAYNPPGLVYTAVLPQREFFNPADSRGNVKGFISATAAANGLGVTFTVSFSNLPTSGGPFPYHIHVAPINSTGSCASALAHLDPFIRGETPVCDPSLPQTCQVGDLSGKYGKITSDPFTATYTDPYVSTLNGLGSFFGNRSFVVHFGNTTRITCANFALVGNATTTSPSTSTTSKPAFFTGSAAALGAPMLSLFVAAAVIMLL